jgi:hypothetical protein
MSGETLSTDTGENQEKVLDPRVESLAIPLARDYAEKNYPKREDGTFEPAWRGVNGEKALKNKSPEDLMEEGYSELAAHEAVIDIANQPYNKYSEYWKEQNRGGAEFLIGLMDERGADALSALDLEDEEVRAEYGDLIHENWISRNEWVKDPNYGDPKLACSFAELSPEEQQKDIDQLGVLQKWIAEQEGNDESKNETATELPAASSIVDLLKNNGVNNQIVENKGVKDVLKRVIPDHVSEEFDKDGNLVFKTEGRDDEDKPYSITTTVRMGDSGIDIVYRRKGESPYDIGNPISDYSSIKIRTSNNDEVIVTEQSKERSEYRVNMEWYPYKEIKESTTTFSTDGVVIGRIGRIAFANNYDSDSEFNSSDEELLRNEGEDL